MPKSVMPVPAAPTPVPDMAAAMARFAEGVRALASAVGEVHDHVERFKHVGGSAGSSGSGRA